MLGNEGDHAPALFRSALSVPPRLIRQNVRRPILHPRINRAPSLLNRIQRGPQTLRYFRIGLSFQGPDQHALLGRGKTTMRFKIEKRVVHGQARCAGAVSVAQRPPSPERALNPTELSRVDIKSNEWPEARPHEQFFLLRPPLDQSAPQAI